MKPIKYLFIVLLSSACTTEKVEEKKATPQKKYANVDLKDKNDTLFVKYEEEGVSAMSGCGYVNRNGDEFIPVNDCSDCFTDTFRTYAIVVSDHFTESKIAGINRKKEVIWEPFLFDNWPDEPSEGLFRVMRNNKIGYANMDGEVVIDTKYGCAYPFENNKAKVALNCESIQDGQEHTTWESEAWFYIDHKGNKVK